MASLVGGMKTVTQLKDLSIAEMRENFRINFDGNFCKLVCSLLAHSSH